MRELILLTKDGDGYSSGDTPLGVFDSIDSAKTWLESEYKDNPSYQFKEVFEGHYELQRLNKTGAVIWTDRFTADKIEYHPD